MIQHFMIFLIETLRDIGNFWLGCVRLCFQSHFMFIVGFLYKQVWMFCFFSWRKIGEKCCGFIKKNSRAGGLFCTRALLLILLMSD